MRDHRKKSSLDVYVSDFSDDALKHFREGVFEAVESGQGFVKVIINSFGGSVYNCLTMMNILESLDVPVCTVCEGYAMSAGAALLTCGDKDLRFAHPDAVIMVHQVSSHTSGTLAEIHTDINQTAKLQDLLFDRMAKNVGKKPGYFQKLIKNKENLDVYMTALDAQKHGIVNELKLPVIQTVNTQHVEVA